MSLGILKNNEIIFSAFLLLILIFLNSGVNTEARPTDVLQPFNSEDKDTFIWLGVLENPNPDREESGLGDEKFLHLKLYTADDNAVIEGLEQMEKSSNLDLQETGIQDEASAIAEADAKAAQVSRTARNAACIERYVYRTIYNYVFRIPICKQGCKKMYRTVNFSNGQTRAIVYDCSI